MSYRVDIPTLSANEVYTLTFEYEGTETIQLIVGDLTLETTDRRVVFTTTSPVYYIESNVNLTNLNMYEGYYESDDFGGEYTQESYIEGKSLVNLCDMKKHVFFQNNVCGTTTYEDNAIKLYISDATTLTSTWQHAGIRTSFGAQEGKTYTCVIQILENTIKTDGIVVTLAGYGTVVHGEGSVSLANGETGTFLATVIPTYNSLKDYGGGIYDAFCRIGFSGDWVTGGSLKYRVMIFEGDHYDDVISGVNYFTGIGCVKSPKIVSIGNAQGFGKGGRL